MNLLITGAWQGAAEHIEEIERMGHVVKIFPYEKDELPCDPSWVEGIIGNGIFLHHPIEQFENLRYIQLTSVGYDRVPMDYVKEHEIEIHNAKGVYSIPMAEFALAGVLSLYKQMPFFFENQKKRAWEKHRGLLELCGKQVLIVGCGDVGTECAKRFQAFGCCVNGCTFHPRASEFFEAVAGMKELDVQLKKADIVVLALALTEQTNQFFSKEKFQLMKNGAILVNLSRGEIIQQHELEIALQDGAIGGAVLDVFEEEPLPKDSILWQMEHVVVTPHNSFVGENNRRRLNNVIISLLYRSLHGLH